MTTQQPHLRFPDEDTGRFLRIGMAISNETAEQFIARAIRNRVDALTLAGDELTGGPGSLLQIPQTSPEDIVTVEEPAEERAEEPAVETEREPAKRSPKQLEALKKARAARSKKAAAKRPTPGAKRPRKEQMNILTPDNEVYGAILMLIEEDEPDATYTASLLAGLIGYVSGQLDPGRGGRALSQRFRSASVPSTPGDDGRKLYAKRDLVEYLTPVDELP